MVQGLIEGIFKTMSPEKVAQLKSAINKVKEFLPIIASYHKTIPLELDAENKPVENKIAYLVVIEETDLKLYQVALKSDQNLKKMVINRTLENYNVIETVTELTANL